MAWNKHWQCCFESLNGNQYAVNVYEQNYSGDVVQLTGAKEPFITQEDESDDIFTPIRTQTGYFRVIDMDGTLLETLIPSNNTEKLVRLYIGTYNNNTFTERYVMWQGFLCADAYTQPWDGNKKIIEFPMKSLLAAMEDVFLPESYLGDEINIAKIFVDAYNALGETPESVYVINNLDDAENDFLKIRVEMAAFFSEETISNEGKTRVEYIASSFLEAISAISKLYGMMVREYREVLYIEMFDNGDGKIGNLQIPDWSNFVNIANGNTFGGQMIGVEETDLLSAFTFAGANNSAGFVFGGKKAKVVINLGGLTFNILLPEADETSDTPIEFQLHSGKLYVQPHSPRFIVENFYYIEYSKGNWIGASNYETMLQKTLINGYLSNPYASADTHLWTGAFPCRWYCQTGSEQVVLKNGLYINTQYRTSQNMGFTPVPNDMYSVNSKIKLKAYDGWIRIDFAWHNIIWADIYENDPHPYFFDDAPQAFGYDIKAEINVALQVGDKFWNGTAWVENGRPYQDYFTIFITNNKINTNKTADMNIFEDDGYFVPVTWEMDDIVTLHILNFVPVSTSNSVYRYCYSHILNDLEVSHVRPIPVVASQRTSNTYLKNIISKGFSDDKVVTTSVGTMNNNVPSACFLKRSISQYVEQLTYYADGGVTYSMRPEINLVNRLAAQFAQIRRTFTAIILGPQNKVLLVRRFTYIGRKFFGILKKISWADDTQEIKFIEVT